MKTLPIIEGLTQRSITLGEMMGDTKGTDAMIARILRAAIPVISAADVFTKLKTDIAAADLQNELLEFNNKVEQIFKEHQ